MFPFRAQLPHRHLDLDVEAPATTRRAVAMLHLAPGAPDPMSTGSFPVPVDFGRSGECQAHAWHEFEASSFMVQETTHV